MQKFFLCNVNANVMRLNILIVSLFFQMKRKTIFVALIATLAFESGVIAVQKNEQLRPKRTLSWPSLPSFLGGSSATPAEAAPLAEDVPKVEVKVSQGPQIVGQYPDASVIGPIISQGQLVNNQLHYPIWRIHKYNGVHLQPLPVSLVRDPNGVAIGSVNNIQSVENELPTQVTSTPVETWLSPELVQMARNFGITDFKNLPSLQQAMDLLGTANREDTNEAIKEYAATEDGRNLIRQFVSNGGLTTQDDNDVAASENQEVVQTAEGVEAKSSGNPVGAASTTQNFFQPISGNVLAQLASLSSRPAQSEQQQEADDSDAVETTTSGSIFSRITQWASFLNPLTNRQEIPIPPSKADVNVRVSLPVNLDDEHIANQNTVPLPPLPELSPLPNIPGVEQAVPPLPTIHIPVRYIGPKIPFTNSIPAQGGPYVRVKLPLAGFNPTPQYNIDPKYLHYGRTLLEQQKVSQVPYVFARVNERKPLQVPVSAPILVNSQASLIQSNQSPSHSGQSIESLQLPTLDASSFSESEATSGSVSQQSAQPVVQSNEISNVQSVIQPAPVVINHTPKIHLTQSETAFQQPLFVNQPLQTIGVQPQQLSSSVQGNPNSPRIRLVQAPLAATTFERPIHVSEPTQQYVSQNLHLPSNTVLQPFRPVLQSVGPPRQALHVGELPLVPTAGYEVIPNGLKALSSYGVPYDYLYYSDNNGLNAYVNRDYELRPAATENKENANVDANENAKSASVNNVVEDPKLNEIENEEKIATARSNSNDKITTDADHNVEIDHDQLADSTVEDKTKTETDLKDIDSDIDNKENNEQADVAITEEEATPEPEPEKPTTNGTIYESLRPSLKLIKTPSKLKKQTHIQRISPPESRSSKIYRADPKAIEMMPLTLRHMARNNAQTEDVQK